MSTLSTPPNIDYSQQFGKEQALDFYGTMYGLRTFDLRCQQLKYKDLIMNGFHPYEGQEAVATGVCSVLRKEDIVHSTHRPQGHSLCKGSTFRGVYGEMLGRSEKTGQTRHGHANGNSLRQGSGTRGRAFHTVDR